MTHFEADKQMKSGAIGFYVIDQKSGAVIFEKNADMGLAVASSQKVITSIAALEMLGTEYRFKTELGYERTVINGALNGNIYLVGHGDPTLGSWRYNNTKEQIVLAKWINAVKEAGIQRVSGDLVCYNKDFPDTTIAGGWVWDDIGNYYGAGVSAANWRGIQYDLLLKSGNKEGDPVSVVYYYSENI